ncbi:MAG: helix-turn-helix domain-containing protein [Thiohalomonadaceae bacterium]
MTTEGQQIDKKSLSLLVSDSGFMDLARACVCFANASGGRLLIGVEDRDSAPPAGQRIASDLMDRLRRRVGELTVNVTVTPELRRASNGGEYIELHVARAPNVASTRDGRYYMRIGDQCRPLVGDEVTRLLNERAALPWETLTTQQVPRAAVDPGKFAAFVRDIRASDRVKSSVKEKSPEELLEHYHLAEGSFLTNLGILCLGRRADRARLGSAPVVQFLKYDELGNKVNKLVWDDYDLSPMELVEAVWREVPDFRERYELPDGLYRQYVPAYDEVVVRELLVNALVHRPYTQRGDIFLNLHPDRLEVVRSVAARSHNLEHSPRVAPPKRPSGARLPRLETHGA